MLDLAALDSTPVNPDPFAHVVVPGFVPSASLAEVVSGLPELSSGGSFPPEALRLGPKAAELTMRSSLEQISTSGFTSSDTCT